MAKSDFTVQPDGSVVFADPNPSDKVREKAYEEAARQRAAATDVDPEEVAAIARESAGLVAEHQREIGTEVQS